MTNRQGALFISSNFSKQPVCLITTPAGRTYLISLNQRGRVYHFVRVFCILTSRTAVIIFLGKVLILRQTFCYPGKYNSLLLLKSVKSSSFYLSSQLTLEQRFRASLSRSRFLSFSRRRWTKRAKKRASEGARLR